MNDTQDKNLKPSCLNLESSKVQSAFSFLMFSTIKNSLVILKDLSCCFSWYTKKYFLQSVCGKCNLMLSQNIKQQFPFQTMGQVPRLWLNGNYNTNNNNLPLSKDFLYSFIYPSRRKWLEKNSTTVFIRGKHFRYNLGNSIVDQISNPLHI